MLQERKDIGDAAKNKILETNPARFYRLPGF
jgi:predicted TIM-barrel fold metal-dependent hydrolase